MRQLRALRGAGVFQQRARRADGRAEVLRAKAGQILHGKMPCQPLAGAGALELPRRQAFDRRAHLLQHRQPGVVRHQDFRRAQPLQLAQAVFGAGFLHHKLTTGQ